MPRSANKSGRKCGADNRRREHPVFPSGNFSLAWSPGSLQRRLPYACRPIKDRSCRRRSCLLQISSRAATFQPQRVYQTFPPYRVYPLVNDLGGTLTKSRLNRQQVWGCSRNLWSGERLNTLVLFRARRSAARRNLLDRRRKLESGEMTFSSECCENTGIVEHAGFSEKAQSQGTLSRAALACIALACAWIAWTHLSGAGTEYVDGNLEERPAPVFEAGAHPSAVANAYARLSAALRNQARRSAAALTSEAALFDSRFSLGFPPGTFAMAAVSKGDREPTITASLSDPGIAAAPQAAPAPAPSLRERVMAKAASAARLLRSPQTRTASLRDGAQANAASEEPAARRRSSKSCSASLRRSRSPTPRRKTA